MLAALNIGKYFFNTGLTVDVENLKTYLEDNPESFNMHTERLTSYGSPHSASSDIWVRYNAPENKGANFNDMHFPVWYPIAKELPDVMGIAFAIMNAVGGEHLGGVLITKVPAGGRIDPHTDSGWHAGFYDKFYIPIKNAEGAKFCFEDGEINPQEGEVYCFDNSVTHWVENNSDQDRIALIVCIRTVLRSQNAA